jgi:RNA polymerase subunit RPABC4/transcription elongation factor Spt4
MKTKYCRHCDIVLYNQSKLCPNCNGHAPWIESYCPSCDSESYVYHRYGFSGRKALAGGIVAGPVGLLSGYINSNDIECICLECQQGWYPFTSNGPTPTKKYREIPEDCYY